MDREDPNANAEGTPPLQRRRWPLGIAVPAAAMVALTAALFAWFAWSSNTASDKAVFDMSEFYLQELSTQTVGHFQTSIKGQVAQLETIVDTLDDESTASEAALQEAVADAKEQNGFAFLAYLDEEGFYHTEEGTYPGVSKIGSLAEILRADEPLVATNETLTDGDMVLVALPIERHAYGDTELVAALAGMSFDTVSAQLSLRKEESQTYSSVLSDDGDYIVHTRVSDQIPNGTNLFSLLEAYATFDSGYSLERLKQEVQDGQAGLASFTMGGMRLFMFHQRIPDTEWFMSTVVPYDVVNASVSGLSTTLQHQLLSGAGRRGGHDRHDIRLLSGERAPQPSRLEAAYRRSEVASASKSSFLSRMSHEIRTPMNGIIGMTQMALDSADNPAKVADCLNKTMRSSRHLMTLLNDVLDMARIESGKTELSCKPFDLADVIGNVVDMILPLAKNKGVRFEVVLHVGTRRALQGDALRITQILSNILSNAVKFTAAGGSVRMAVQRLDGEGVEGWTRFTVSDTGVGIAPENIEKVFSAFEQENADVVSTYGGTGLGLSIVKSFVDMMEGTIEVESELGVGTTMAVSLPLEDAPNAADGDDVASGERAVACAGSAGAPGGPVREGGAGAPGHAAAGEVDEALRGLCVFVADPDAETRETLACRLRVCGLLVEATGDRERVRVVLAGASPAGECALEGGLRAGEGFAALLVQASLLAGVDVVKQPEILHAMAYDLPDAIDAVAQLGAGTTLSKPVFTETVCALLRGDDQDGSAENDEDAFDFSGSRILVVEDTPVNLEIIVDMVEALGAEVESAADGEEAVRAFERSDVGHFDLVLMDIQMPRMNGLEAARAIREMDRPDAATVPIYAMSANAFEEDRKHSMEAGMNGHLSKPIEAADVRACLVQELEG